MTFNEGDIIRCINAEGLTESLVVEGEFYEVAKNDTSDDGRFVYLNINGRANGGFFTDRFELAKVKVDSKGNLL